MKTCARATAMVSLLSTLLVACTPRDVSEPMPPERDAAVRNAEGDAPPVSVRPVVPVPAGRPRKVHAVPGIIKSTDVRGGAGRSEGVGYHDTTPGYNLNVSGHGNQAGNFPGTDLEIDWAYWDRASDGSDASTKARTASICLPGGGDFDVWMDNGEWLAYDISAGAAGTFAFVLRLGYGGTSRIVMHLEVDGADVSGPLVLPLQADVPKNGSPWHHFFDLPTPPVTLTAGAHTVRLWMDGGARRIEDQPWVHYLNVTLAR